MFLRYALLVACLAAPAVAAQPDLTLLATAEDASGTAGDRVTLDYTVSLTGAEEIEDISVGFYFSTDQTLSSDDTLSEREEVDAESDESESDNEQIDIPASLADGEYFILVVIDDLEQVAESNEDNNTEAIPFTVGGGGTGGGGGADLTITSVSAEPASGAAGAEVEGEYAIANTGSEQAGESQVGFYLSTGRNLSSGDTFLTREDADEVDANGDGDGDFEFTVPASLAAGDYFLLAVADDRNVVDEDSENNNVASTPFTVTGDGGGGSGEADLRITSASVTPTSANPGASVELAYTLANTGSADAGETQVGVYISTDRELSSNDVLVTRLDADGLGAGGSEDSDEDASVPNNLSAGDYFVLFVADDRNTVAESRESNNTRAVPFTVTGSGGTGDGEADLRIADAAAEPTSAAAGETVEVSYSLANTGTGDAGASQVAVYFSRDNSLSSSDMRLNAMTAQPLDADNDQDGEVSVTVPEVAPGDYFLLVVADDGNDVAESRESNNVRAVPFTIATGTAAEGDADAAVSLGTPSPNPVRGSADVTYALAAAGHARVVVTDVLGRQVAVLAAGPHAAGDHQVTWNADALAAGLYVLRIETAGTAVTKTATVVR